jgi:3-deoxy-manno-octulosonate cytidylyltransferase (CMP-KDO synthetase)
MVKIVGFIPARMGSSRFPGKPLEKIHGIPMVGHVFFRSKMSKLLDDLYIATCDEEIKEYFSSINEKIIMTSDKHTRASDRIAEAFIKVEKQTNERIDIVVMIQGDEPMTHPEMIDEAVQPLLDNEDILVSNLMAPLKSKDEHYDPNEVKVVVDCNNNALYFSREPIPTNKKEKNDNFRNKQVCIIPFRRDFLIKFNELEPTPLEIIESVDMLRVLEHGYDVKMIPTKFDTYSVDTKEDLKRVEKIMENDKLMKKYITIEKDLLS